ncbi:MAG TPA: extracellular solute-binding protein [Lentisphaeria bacterium]|nr:extracellular solute-binding protein [Lentisphaeria bacterium]
MNIRTSFWLTLLCSSLMLSSLNTRAGEVRVTEDGRTIITVSCWSLPEPTRTDVNTRAEVAVVKEFIRRFPEIFQERYAAKYAANPAKYGNYDWRNVEVELKRFAGIQIEGAGMDSGPLMAIAGGVAPDIMYVNFRQSDTYIQEGFLYPLDKPEDGYFAALSKDEVEFMIHEKLWPVIKRKGPKGTVQVWSMPMGGILGRVFLYRKDLLDAAGVPYPTNDWTWEDLFEACKKLTNPEKGTYGIKFGAGKSESWYWITFLWSAGGEAMVYDEAKEQWQAAFNDRAAAVALDYYIRLNTEKWTETVDGKVRTRYGYATKEAQQGNQKWELGQIGFNPAYIDERIFSTLDPDVVGMVAAPLGYPDENGVRHRGGEINSRMQGIYAGCDNIAVRDAAWEYLRFLCTQDAEEIRTRIKVEGGLGRFVNPRYLRMFGYDDLIRLAPPGWEDTFKIAMDTGKPEPYGKNCQLVYFQMTKPMERADAMAMNGVLPLSSAEEMENATPEEKEKRLSILRGLLEESVIETNEKMIGILTPKQKLMRRSAAFVLLIAIVAAFTLVFKKIIKAFTPPKIEGMEQVTWGFRKYKMAYLLLLPALLTILVWRYVPLVMGSMMSLQDYRIMGGSTWVWLDNFGNVLWDAEWWASVWNSLRYCFLVIMLTFLPPVILAVLLQEIPHGKIFFRTVFYLPAVITGLVVIYLWRSFYEKTEFGVLNAIMLKLPAITYIGIAILFFFIMFFFAKRLFVHENYLSSLGCLIAGILMFCFFFQFSLPILLDKTSDASLFAKLFHSMRDPYRWLEDPKTAMICCVLPMVWAGMGPGCLIYLAALKGIADDFYEAADIDGATFIDKILFVVIPILRPLLIIQFIGVFIRSWENSAFILAMTGGASQTEVAGLHIFYKAYMYLKFGPATAMAWILGFMLIGFTVHQLQILSKLEFKAAGAKK